MYQTGCNAYKQSAANTIEGKPMILLKLYEGALVFIGIAKRGIENNSPKIRGENISKVMAIIDELERALDHERGGEIAARLSSLYQYAMERLLCASRYNDIEALEQVKQVITLLKEGFEGAVRKQKKSAVAVATPSSHVVAPMSAPAPQRPVQCAV